MRDKIDKSAAREEFARRLQTAMLQKGLSQTELAVACKNIAPLDVRFERDTISTYIRAIAMPTPKRLAVIAKVLDTTAEELMPFDFLQPGFKAAPRTPVRSFDDIGDGMVWLTIKQAVPYGVALKVLALLEN